MSGSDPPPDPIETLARELDRLRTELKLPGMSVAVLQEQEVIFAHGFGFADIEHKTPATADTAYEIASLTKPFAATVIMQLVEAGQLDLDAAMADLVGETVFTFPPPADAPVEGYAELCVVLRELSLDTSGPLAPYASLFADYRCDRERITVRHHLTHTSQGAPGDGYRYNGFLYGLLSWVAEAVTGESLRDLLVHRIIAPLAMTGTLPSGNEARDREILAHIARPYRVDEAGQIVAAEYTSTGYLDAGSGIISTVMDLARFDIALDRNTLLSSDTRTMMFTAVASNDGSPLPYGLGWFVQTHDGLQIVWHYGWQDAYSSLILKIPEREITFILLVNSDGASAPFNLGDGDVMASPFATLFVDLFAGNATE